MNTNIKNVVDKAVGGDDDDGDGDEKKNEIPREVWSKKLDFLMSIIGFSVDLAGVWRL